MAISIIQSLHNLKWSKSRLLLPSRLHPYVLSTLAELLSEGFSLNQAFQFLTLLLPKHTLPLSHIQTLLAQGEPIEKCLQAVGFPIKVVAQLFYAQRQARFQLALVECAKQLTQLRTFKQKLVKQLSYPLLMCLLLIGLLFGMRTFMLPHITSFITQSMYDKHLLVRLLIHFFTYLPQLFIGIISLVCVLTFSFHFYLMTLPLLKRLRILCHLPYFHKWVRWYTTYHFSYEFGYFFAGGFSIQQALSLVIDYPIDPLLVAIATSLHEGFVSGHALPDQLQALNIFTTELPYVIHQGELTSQTAQKCLVYAQKIFNDFMEEIGKKLNLVQPLLFIFIALLVLAMYLMMMLPMLTMESL